MSTSYSTPADYSGQIHNSNYVPILVVNYRLMFRLPMKVLANYLFTKHGNMVAKMCGWYWKATLKWPE